MVSIMPVIADALRQPSAGPLASQTNRYIREVLHIQESPPPVTARFFYTSPLAIDDPLSPTPPPLTSASTPSKHPPRPFSEYDNGTLENAWLKLRTQILKYYEENGGEKGKLKEGDSVRASGSKMGSAKLTPVVSPVDVKRESLNQARGIRDSVDEMQGDITEMGTSQRSTTLSSSLEELGTSSKGGGGLPSSLNPLDVANPNITGAEMTRNPFIRAPTRTKAPTVRPDRSTSRPPAPKAFDSYDWGEDHALYDGVHENGENVAGVGVEPVPEAHIPVGVSRLHQVSMPNLR